MKLSRPLREKILQKQQTLNELKIYNTEIMEIKTPIVTFEEGRSNNLLRLVLDRKRRRNRLYSLSMFVCISRNSITTTKS